MTASSGNFNSNEKALAWMYVRSRYTQAIVADTMASASFSSVNYSVFCSEFLDFPQDKSKSRYSTFNNFGLLYLDLSVLQKDIGGQVADIPRWYFHIRAV